MISDYKDEAAVRSAVESRAAINGCTVASYALTDKEGDYGTERTVAVKLEVGFSGDSVPEALRDFASDLIEHGYQSPSITIAVKAQRSVAQTSLTFDHEPGLAVAR